MKYTLIVSLILGLSGLLAAQPVTMDTVKNQRILIGKVLKAHISDSTWYTENYNAGIVTGTSLQNIEEHSDGISVEVYFGSWCDDSQYWVPAFIGLVEESSLSSEVQLIALPRSKTSEETKKLEEIIERVPTFVFWRNGKEIGRIVESPEETLAKDMIKILKR